MLKRFWAGFRALFGAQDMTVGNPVICLLKFSVPLLIGNFAQMLYSTVDSIIVGKYVGDLALAAVGVSGPIQNMFLILFMAIGTGVTVMVAQYYGAKDLDKLGYAIGNAITLIIIATVFITACGIPLAGPLLRLIRTTDDVFDMAKVYLVIMFLGSLGNGFYNIISGILRGLGEAIFPLIILLLTTVLNIVLDLWFIAGLGWGIAGAAWATIISQTLSGLICLVRLFRMKDIVTIKPSLMRLKKFYSGKIIALGLPSGISQGILFVSILFVQTLINSMGSMVVACTTAIMRVDGFAILPAHTFNMSASTYTGQNIGAGNLERVRRGKRDVLIMSLVASVILVALILLFGRTALGWFTETQAIIDLGMRMLRIMAVAYCIMAVMMCYHGVMNGAGDTRSVMWISIMTNVVIRIPVAYIWAHFSRSDAWPTGSPDSIYVSMLVSWALGTLITLIYYRTGRWKTKSIVGAGAKS